MAVSVRGKKAQKPIFGFDVSTQLFEVQISGEAALRNGKDINTLNLDSMKIETLDDTWIPRASVNLMKFFPLSGVADRVMVSTEFYYNHAGYEINVFKGGINEYLRIISSVAHNLDTNQTYDDILSLYEPNSYSKYYGMLSTSISRFILNDMTFTCSAVGNLNQRCAMLSGGVSYQSLHDFMLSANVNGFVGKKNTEYTFTDQGLSLQLRMGLVF
jgi:hypothetical protein